MPQGPLGDWHAGRTRSDSSTLFESPLNEVPWCDATSEHERVVASIEEDSNK